MKHFLHRIGQVPSQLAIGLIKLYRLILSPWLGRSCRFEPTCSVFTEQAIRQYGFWKGSWLGLRRIGRCHPWHEGGYDPVPDKRT